MSPEQEFEVTWRGGDGRLDQMPDPEPVDGGPTRAAVDWHELAKHAPEVEDDERSMPAVADRKVLRRRGYPRVTSTETSAPAVLGAHHRPLPARYSAQSSISSRRRSNRSDRA